MNIFIDTEFNGFNGELLSMGLIADDGQFFYEWLEFDNDYRPWVKENVAPHLAVPLEAFAVQQDAVPMDEFQAKLESFLNQYNHITLIADWPDDIKYFCEAVITGPGTRILLPKISFILDLDLEAGQHSYIQHHAGFDAVANQYIYNSGQ
jgi:hypothetical protein